MDQAPENTGSPSNFRKRAGPRLTDSAIRQVKPTEKPHRLTDGGGLYLLLQPNGGRWWRFDYRFEGRRKTISLGTYPDVSLAKARNRHREARELLADGIDPSAIRQAEKAQRQNAFQDVAERWIEDQKRAWSESHTKTVRYRLDHYLMPKLGRRPVGAIEPPELLAVLQPLKDRPETAKRAKQIAGQVFRYAVAHGLAQRDPTADLRGALPPSKPRSHSAITDPREVGPLIRAIEGYEGHPIVRNALRLAPLVFVRPGELRHMEWAEIDLDRAEWRIPAEKMKMREAHIVPLAPQAITILEEIHPLTGRGRYVFPSVRSSQRPLSENSLNAALRRMGYTKHEMTTHGFRAMASTLLNEQGWPPDVIERQLAHRERNQVRAAYNRASHMGKRWEMMEHWADYLDGLAQGAEIVSIGRVYQN